MQIYTTLKVCFARI